MINWVYFPKSAKPTLLTVKVVEAFGKALPLIDSTLHEHPSNVVLAYVAPTCYLSISG